MLRTFRDDNSSWFPLIPAQAGTRRTRSPIKSGMSVKGVEIISALTPKADSRPSHKGTLVRWRAYASLSRALRRCELLGLKDAIAIATKYVKDHSDASGIELALIAEPIFESEICWVFAYDSIEHLRTNSISAALAGNAPILIDKHTGALHVTGTAYPTEHYVAKYISKKGSS